MAQNENEIYKRIKLLGEGSFGKAYLVECLQDGTLCVIKQVDLTQMKEDERKETIKEARILEALRHPNIVKFREVYKTKKGRLCIVMDYADGGDLSNKIKQTGSCLFSEVQILDWFTQICLAIKHVHDRKIIHRDLKTQNIFLTSDGIIKLGDFGIARVLNHTREKCKTIVGTPYYLSPEIIESRDYSFKTDIWSLGIILYELCALKPPFNAESLHGLALKIVRGQYNPIPDKFSTNMRQLISQLLQVDPNRRPNIHEVLKMPIIVNRIRSVLSESIRNAEFSHTILHKQNFVNHNLIVPYDTEIRSVHSQPNLGKPSIQQQQQQQQPSNYLMAFNARGQPLNNLQKQKQLYQQVLPSNYDYISKPQQQQNYNPYMNYQKYQYNNKQPQQQQQQPQQQQIQPLQVNNRPNISPLNVQRNDKSPYYEDRSPMSKSPFNKDLRDKSPFELQREQVRQQIKRNEEKFQQLQENRQKYLQPEKYELPKLSREPYSQPQIQYKFQKQQSDPVSVREPIKFEPIKEQLKEQQPKQQIESQLQQQQPISQREQRDSVYQAQAPQTERIQVAQYISQPPPSQQQQQVEIIQKAESIKPNKQQLKESQLILQEIREIKNDTKDDREKMKQFMEMKKQRNSNTQSEIQEVIKEATKTSEELENEASQLLAELEDIVIAAEGGDVKHSQVINVCDGDLINMQSSVRESVDREDDDSLEQKSNASNENGERENFQDDEDIVCETPKELLYQILLRAIGQEQLNKYLTKIQTSYQQDYVNLMINGFEEIQQYKALIFMYECM